MPHQGQCPPLLGNNIQTWQKLAVATISFSNSAYAKLAFVVMILHIRRNWPQFLLDRIGLELPSLTLACVWQCLAWVWTLFVCAVRGRHTSLLSIFLKTHRFKPRETSCTFFIQWQNLPSLTVLALWALCVWHFSVCVLLTSWSATTITLGLRWPSGKLWPIAWYFKSSHKFWQLFFMASINMICKDTRHREREHSDAVRRCQGVCLFALIAAKHVLGH